MLSAPYTITNLPSPVANITGAGILCPGTSLTLTATGGTGYVWSTGPVTPTLSVSAAGTYSVTASNSCGSDVASVTIVMDNILADFTASPVTGLAPLEVSFTNTSSASAVGFNWDFGNGSNSTAVSPSTTYNLGGTYVVTLIATTINGCSDTKQLTIDVTENPSTLIIPNVFSPNGDGVNDLFKIEADYIENFQATIFNRWGKEMISWNDVSRGWDGKDAAGNVVTEGTYFYVIQAKGRDKKEYLENGSVTLVR
jgi:gliding motility-associated-like protein